MAGAGCLHDGQDYVDEIRPNNRSEMVRCWSASPTDRQVLKFVACCGSMNVHIIIVYLYVCLTYHPERDRAFSGTMSSSV